MINKTVPHMGPSVVGGGGTSQWRKSYSVNMQPDFEDESHVFTQARMHGHCMCTACALCMHCMYTACALPVHVQVHVHCMCMCTVHALHVHCLCMCIACALTADGLQMR